MTILGLWLTLCSAQAQDAPELLGSDDGASASRAVALGLRYRALTLPHSTLDPWFHDSDDPIVLGQDRPDARGFAVGLEVSPNGLASGVRGYVEYAGLHLDPGYWDAKDTDKSNVEIAGDGDWVEAQGLGWIGLGAEYRHVMPLVEPEADWNLGLHFGGGVGAAVTLGSISQWYGNNAPDYEDPSCSPVKMAYDRTDCPVDNHPSMPPVLPILDAVLGVNAQIGDRMGVRIEGGLHNLPFFGVGVSGRL